MKKYMIFMLLCCSLLLSACSQAKEDTVEHSGVISEGKAIGYEYAVTKEKKTYTWEVGYKGATSIIQESPSNEIDLENFRNAVGDSKEAIFKLIIWASYFIIIAISVLIFYKRNRKVLKDGGAIITALAVIAIYLTFEASLDLSQSLTNAEYYYMMLF